MSSRNYTDDQAHTVMSKRTLRGARAPWITIGALIGLCCLVGLSGVTGYYFLSSSGTGLPLVLIHEPQNGERLEVGELTTVRAVASDQRRIVRVELWVDGQLQQTETSNVQGGITSFPLLTDWQPASAGNHTLTVRAFNSLGLRAHSTIKIDAISDADRDGDGLADDQDACPDEPGLETSNGCPDRDRDGTPDASDSCPDTAGIVDAAGCPMVSEGDRDGDGVLDETDVCPDDPGSPLTEGCPDSDGDFIPDVEDACPGEPGAGGEDGCPTPGDSDSDGFPDTGDACPDAWGPPELDGCPEEAPLPGGGGIPEGGGIDSDGDGAADSDDPCPEEAGRPEDDYCLPPEADPMMDDGPIFELPGYFFFDAFIPAFVEFEALHFEVSQDYRRIWCYASLAGGDVDRYEFDPSGILAWNIEEVLGGANSVHLAVQPEDPLEVFAECYGTTGFFFPRPYYLGSIQRQHIREEWDGHVIEAESTGGEPGGHSFTVRYHLCDPSCEATALQPPVITRHTSERHEIRLYWDWEGDPRTIEGFKVYMNDNYRWELPREERSFSWNSPSSYCADELEFHLTAYDGPDSFDADVESAPGNSIIWEMEPCEKHIRVTFETLAMHSPPNDREGSHSAGPLWGEFNVTAGGDMKALRFDGERCYRFPVPPFEECFGLRLEGGEHSIQGLFDWIHTQIDACRSGHVCHARRFSAADTDTVTIEVGPDEDLVIGARIHDVDERDDDDMLFEGQIIVNTSELSPDETLMQTIPGRFADVIVKIDLFPFGE